MKSLLIILFKNIFLLFLISFNFSQIVRAQDKVMIVFDASGSMWGQIDGKAKIDIAKSTLNNLIGELSNNQLMGLVSYGHRRKGDCNDIETILPISPLNHENFKSKLDSINPKGKTPLSASVLHAAKELKYTEDKATIILLTDGLETCDLDPCKLAENLSKDGIDFTAHVIGFDVGSLNQESLKCLANTTGGKYLTANNASELSKALKDVSPILSPTPSETKAPKLNKVGEIISADKAVIGTELTFTVKGDIGMKGMVHLYKINSNKSISYDYVRENDQSNGYMDLKLRMPADEGRYVIKWLDNSIQYASKEIDVVKEEIIIISQDTAYIGTEVELNFKAPENIKGMVNLYILNSNKSLSYDYLRENDKGEGYKTAKLRMPKIPGKYEIRLENKPEVYASKFIEVTQADINLVIPKTATIGTEINVDFKAPDGMTGMIHLFQQGSDKSLAYDYVREHRSENGYSTAKLRMPSKSGIYEIKWTQNNEIYATSQIEVLDAEIKIIVPENVNADSEILVSLSAPEGLIGILNLYRMGSSKSVAYAYVREKNGSYNQLKIKIPSTPGKYEIKWEHKNDIYAVNEFNVN